MDRVVTFLLHLGVSRAVVNWLLRRRLLGILMLGLLAWVPVIVLVWLFLRLPA